MSEPHAVAYKALRIRMCEVVTAAEPASLQRFAPATPEWRVHDVIAHMVGVTDDIVNGRMDGIATDAWTAAQVEPRRNAPLDEMLEEWEAHSPTFEEMLAAVPAEIAGQALFDASTHEHDVRHALASPGARDSDAIALGWEWICDARTRGGGPSMRFVTENGEIVAGAGDDPPTVTASRFELVRATSGRRSASEIASYTWDRDPMPERLLAAPIFTLRAEPLGE
jgi:uncharacterized protein (TIGR03083 family)